MTIDTTNGEELVLTFKDQNLDALRFRIRPTLRLAWGIKMYSVATDPGPGRGVTKAGTAETDRNHPGHRAW
jgi:hypothetical protein